ncbi:MAG: translation initiation factor 2 [Clostridiales bacterium]|nr:translation initiation factor 2 [Clostridiales bacterium]
MVKGVTRQVVMVRSPDAELFEQAIFLVRSDAVGRDGVTDEEILQQARAAAGRYMAERVPGAKLTLRRLAAYLACGLLGGALVGLVWFLTSIL